MLLLRRDVVGLPDGALARDLVQRGAGILDVDPRPHGMPAAVELKPLALAQRLECERDKSVLRLARAVDIGRAGDYCREAVGSAVSLQHHVARSAGDGV